MWPLGFLLPVYRGARVGRLRFRLGLSLYDLLAGRRQPVGRHESFSRRGLLRECPHLQADGLRGGFRYGDCGTDDARLVLEIVAAAHEAGVTAVNHARAVELLRAAGRVAGARVRDELSGSECELRARLVINATGPWADKLLPLAAQAQRYTRLIQGAHLVMPALPGDDAMLLTADDGRVFFLIPWYGRTLLGTTEADDEEVPQQPVVREQDVDYLLRNANRALSGVHWTADDIEGSFPGLAHATQRKRA